MPARPNFTGAQIVGDTVRVTGASDEDDTEDILDIRVTLVQGDRIASEPVPEATSVWNAAFPVKDPEAKGGDFGPGPAAVFGVETHKTNLTTISWVEALTIR